MRTKVEQYGWVSEILVEKSQIWKKKSCGWSHISLRWENRSYLPFIFFLTLPPPCFWAKKSHELIRKRHWVWKCFQQYLLLYYVCFICKVAKMTMNGSPGKQFLLRIFRIWFSFSMVRVCQTTQPHAPLLRHHKPVRD